MYVEHVSRTHKISFFTRRNKLTCASLCESATLWRSRSAWFRFFSSDKAFFIASKADPHSSRSGFYGNTWTQNETIRGKVIQIYALCLRIMQGYLIRKYTYLHLFTTSICLQKLNSAFYDLIERDPQILYLFIQIKWEI